ncbi:gliding-associated putative ABC transporter substrate-binding component GldG [Luteitalea pratensis]|uniref:Gliding-associated putative ABC transporter substrate-binding component GldG n=1 Tax=Luteitalea pratensis TaxID=1855912 RepID=A0A143PI81_LUTPR|nr:Gldg family protein [Luteitalea pratensis]AMY07474.1 gliding-associated putative ABC transporter substrate-binding component GldG [Luteitalea pratensis]
MTRFVNVLGWIGTALVVAAVAIRFIRPEQQHLWQRLALAGLVVVLAYLVTQWRDFVALWSRRGTRAGALTSASVLLLLGILVGVNYIASRQHKRWDLTAGGQFTLSDQSRKVLDGLKTPVNVKVFAKDTEFQRFRDRLDGYTYASPQLKVEYIDPDKQPAVARQWQVQQYGTIAVDYNGRIERVTTDTEQDITNAIVKAVEGGEKKVYFSQGHGERDTTSADQRSGYNAIAGALQRDNFAVDKVVLAQQQDVPADAAVLVIAGPKNDFLQPELDMVRRYLDKGGKLLLLIDPPDGAEAAPLTGLIALAKAWGVEVGTNVVVDVSSVGQLLGAGPSVPVVATYPDHPITENFGLITAFPLARAVTPVEGGTNGRTAQPIATTSAQSWAETDLKAVFAGTPVQRDEAAGEKEGPVTLAVAVGVDAPNAKATPPPPPPVPGQAPPETPAKPQTRVVVIGDSDFATNAVLGTQGNRDFFLNAVNWVAQQENLIAIRPKQAGDRRVTMTEDQQRRVLYLSVLGLPLIVAALGIWTWSRRRG